MAAVREFLFAYGTLLEPGVQQAVFGRLPEGEPDFLVGFEKREGMVEGAYPGLVRAPEGESRVAGRRLHLAEGELSRADAYEGVGYHRAFLELASGNRAWVYLPVQHITV